MMDIDAVIARLLEIRQKTGSVRVVAQCPAKGKDCWLSEDNIYFDEKESVVRIQGGIGA